MGRAAKPWFREATGWWMVTHRGEQVKLSQDKKEAQKAFHALKANETPPEEESGPRPTLKHLVGLYLDEAKATKTPETYDVQRRCLTGFCEAVGPKKAPDVRPPHVKDWLAMRRAVKNPQGRICKDANGEVKYRVWGDSTRAQATSTVIALFNWAVAEGRLAVNPIKGMKRGVYKRREQIIPPAHREKIFQALPEGLRDFLTVVSLTGARPYSEVGKFTAEGIDWERSLVSPAKHKTAKKGRLRVIMLVPEAVAILKKYAAEHPKGPLFLTTHGNPWCNQVVNRAIKRAGRSMGLPDYNSYDLRRSFITDGLAKGLGASVVAQLAGNTPAIINKFYDSLHLRLDVLRAAMELVSGDGSTPRPSQ